MAALAPRPVPPGYRYALIAVLAASMGAQNATARRLAVAASDPARARDGS